MGNLGVWWEFRKILKKLNFAGTRQEIVGEIGIRLEWRTVRTLQRKESAFVDSVKARWWWLGLISPVKLGVARDSEPLKTYCAKTLKQDNKCSNRFSKCVLWLKLSLLWKAIRFFFCDKILDSNFERRGLEVTVKPVSMK